MTTPLPVELRSRAELLQTIADDVGTPAYVHDLDQVRHRLAEITSLRDVVAVEPYFSPKPNPVPAIARAAIAAGCGIDACSAFDVLLASRIGADAISFCTHALLDEDLDAVVASGAHFVADSERQLVRYRTRVPDAGVGIRVNVGVAAGFHEHVAAARPESRFGMARDAIKDLADRHEGVVGLHCHIGSDVDSSDRHLEALDVLLELAVHLPEVGYVNLGGGYRIPFVVEEAAYDLMALGTGAATRLDRFANQTGRRLRLRIEPGNYVTRDAGYLLVRVIEVRAEHGAQLLQVDGNVGQLPGALLYGTEHPTTLLGEDPGELQPSTVTGVLMQPGDVLRRSALLPPARCGEVVAFGLAGAYSGVRASTFNGRPVPAEVVVDGSTYKVARPASTPAELLEDWL